jgi:hypothetical protein
MSAPHISFSAGSVTFEPGARSAWHTQPAGQYLIVTAGTGWTQAWGGPVTQAGVPTPSGMLLIVIAQAMAVLAEGATLASPVMVSLML